MAEVQENQSDQDQGAVRLRQLKADLESYRELLLPLNKVLEWDQQYYPAVLVGAITVVFAIIWYLEPSVLTTFSLLGVLVSFVDFIVPTLSSYFFSSREWTVIQERQYEAICIRLINASTHTSNLKTALCKLKAEKPKVYLVVMMGAFAALAWIGCLIDNLMLTYLLVVFVVLLPGLRKHGIIQKWTASAITAVGGLLKKAKKKKN